MKKIIAIMLVLVMALSAVACQPDTPNPTDPESSPESTPSGTPSGTPAESPTETPTETEAKTDAPTEPPVVTTSKEDALKAGIVLANSGKLQFKIVAATSSNKKLQGYIDDATDKITNAAQYRGGAEGTNAGATFEILIGDTGRSESVALKSTIGANQYAIKLLDNALVIVASNEIFLYDAVAHFTNTYFTPEHSAMGSDYLVLLTKDINIKADANLETVRYLFSTTNELYASGQRLYTIAAASPANATQGGGTDGEFGYQGFIKRIDLVEGSQDEKKNQCVIVKYRLSTGNIIKKSKVLDLNHTNDITYNERNNTLVVVHNNPYRYKLTIIDAATLTVKETKNLAGHNFYAITYNAEKNLYAMGLSHDSQGPQDFQIFDGNFKMVGSRRYTTPMKYDSMTTQGICSDDNYTYAVLWDAAGYKAGNTDNVIIVRDWDGNFVGVIHIAIGSIEPENIYIVDGEIRVTAHNGGAEVYRIFRLRTEK